MACWYGLRLSGLIACVFVCCDFTGGFWLAGGLKRALATQLGTSDSAKWSGVLSDSARLENAVNLCRFIHLWLPHPRKARVACASQPALVALSSASITRVRIPTRSATHIHAPKRSVCTAQSTENSQHAHRCRFDHCLCVLWRQHAHCHSYGGEGRDARRLKMRRL